MPSEILEDKGLYEPNSIKVMRTLKSLGGQKRSKYADPELVEWIKASSFYNERIELIKEGLEQQMHISIQVVMN